MIIIVDYLSWYRILNLEIETWLYFFLYVERESEK